MAAPGGAAAPSARGQVQPPPAVPPRPEGRQRGKALWVVLAVLLVVAVLGATTVVAGPDRVKGLLIEPASPTPTVPRPTPTTQPAALGKPEASAAPDAAAVRRALAGPMGAKALGDQFGAYVVDPSSGETLFNRGGATAATPASTAKLATSVAALHKLGPTERLETKVVRTDDAVVLVGGGDPTLVARSKKQSKAAYPKYARLQDLAVETAAALGDSRGKVTVQIDDSLFTGPRTAPGWKPNYVPEGTVAPVSALAVDHGMTDPRRNISRAPDPAMSAGAAFVEMLEKRGVSVRGEVDRTTVGADATELAEVESPPVAELVEDALVYSDNDLAEALARHVALEYDEPASFAGARTGVHRALRGLGVAKGIDLYDGSGLSTRDAVTPRALTEVLTLVASGKRPELSPVLSGLPVGGFSGTLHDRFGAEQAEPGVGVVRAKTGTLSDVSSLAGTVQDQNGRTLVFAFVANGIPQRLAWQTPAALDRLSAALAACTCS